jgi:predicted ArsR family transcriptional regulator
MATDIPAAAVPAVPGRRDLILQLLRTSARARSIVSMADEMAVHPNTIRFHLDALLRTGRVEQVFGETSGPGRPPVLFRASRRMDPAGPTNYRLLANILTSYLAATPTAAAVELGRSWGPSLVDGHRRRTAPSKTQSITDLTELLADLGFQPETSAGPRASDIRLRHCPFHELVETYGEMLCSVHLGLMQGALATMRAPVTVDHLDPFVEPDLCVAHLAPASAAHNAGARDRRKPERTHDE